MSEDKWSTYKELLKRSRQEAEELNSKLFDVECELETALDKVKEYVHCYSCGVDQYYK